MSATIPEMPHVWTTWGHRDATDPILVSPYVEAVPEMYAADILGALETTIKNQPKRKHLYILNEWSAPEEFGYEHTTPPILDEIATDVMDRSNGRIEVNMGVIKRYHTENDTTEGFVSGALERHVDLAWFHDPESVAWVHDPILDDYVARPGPDNMCVLLNVYGQADLTTERYVGLSSRLVEQVIPYEPGSGAIISSNVLHSVTEPLDIFRRPDPTGERGLVFLGFDHRLVPANPDMIPRNRKNVFRTL